MKRLTFACSVNIYSGYGQLCHEIISGFAQRNYYVSVRAISRVEPFGKIPIEFESRIVHRLQPELFEVVIHPPEVTPTPGKKTIYFTMWESTKLPKKALEVLGQAEAIVVPNHWNAATFSTQLDKPIYVVPLGIDPTIFSYSTPKLTGPCVFGCSGRMGAGPGGGPRKNINRVISIFQKAFPGEQDVRLKIKVFSDCAVARPEDPRVEHETRYLTAQELAMWMRSLTAFVCASRGEGWGLLHHQAMAVGRPVLGVRYGGLAEFLNEHNGYPIRFTHEAARDHYQDCGTWPEISEDDMIEKMRFVYKNRDHAFMTGIQAHRTAMQFTWDRTCRELEGVLEKVGAL